MRRPPRHPTPEDLVDAAFGRLPQAALRGVREHVAGCAACAERLRQDEAAQGRLARLRGQAPDAPRADLAGDVLRRLEAAERAEAGERAGGRPSESAGSAGGIRPAPLTEP